MLPITPQHKSIQDFKMVGRTIRLVKRKPESEWVSSLLHSKFFGSCVDHSGLRKNEKNVFCIDCNLCFCKHCIGSSAHSLHRWLQICKYVYHFVVRLQDIQKHLDCSKIQTYKINGEKAIHLNPRPQSKDSNKPTKSKTGVVSCETCGRHLQELPNRFCSIACKVTTGAEMSDDQKNHKMMISARIPDFGEISLKGKFDREVNIIDGNQIESSPPSVKDSLCVPSEGFQACWMSLTLKPKKQLRKRKGVPRRAPLC